MALKVPRPGTPIHCNPALFPLCFPVFILFSRLLSPFVVPTASTVSSRLRLPHCCCSSWLILPVCAIKYNQRGDEKNIMQIIPVAGDLGDKGLNAKTSLLPSAETTQVEGVKVELHGPEYKEQQQMAVIELTCDRSLEV